jgi:hypothetical protein
MLLSIDDEDGEEHQGTCILVPMFHAFFRVSELPAPRNTA